MNFISVIIKQITVNGVGIGFKIVIKDRLLVSEELSDHDS